MSNAAAAAQSLSLSESGNTSPRSMYSWRPVTQYSWTDDGEKVKIYISQPEVLEIAQKDAPGIARDPAAVPPQVSEIERAERDKGRYGGMDKYVQGRIGYSIQCALCARGVEIRFRDPEAEKAGFKFRLGPFEYGKQILFSEEELVKVPTYKVTEKKITVTLKKKDASLRWYDLKQGKEDVFDNAETKGESTPMSDHTMEEL